MIILGIAAAIATAQPAAGPPLDEAANALSNGRVDQARIMIGNAVRAGVQGPQLDRLLADMAFASNDFQTALIRYEALLASSSGDSLLAERGGICAIHLGDRDRATRLIMLSTASPAASWRAWNARAVLADQRGEWEESDLAYDRAASLAPVRPEILNNRGWSLLTRSRWSEALALLEQASVLDPKSARIANNLELAKAALSEDLPRRRDGESDGDWAARLNDAGLLAGVRGDRKRAIAAFAQAIVARHQWFDRAANNLAVAERGH